MVEKNFQISKKGKSNGYTKIIWFRQYKADFRIPLNKRNFIAVFKKDFDNNYKNIDQKLEISIKNYKLTLRIPSHLRSRSNKYCRLIHLLKLFLYETFSQ